MKDKIYTLANNYSYYVLEELDYEGKKYILTVECDPKRDSIKEDELNVFEVSKSENGDLVLKALESNQENIIALLIDKHNKN